MRIDLAHIRRMADVIATTDDHDAETGFLDTLAGETPIEEIADWLIASILDDEAQIVSLEAQIETMQTRLARKKVRARGKRKVGAEMLQAAGLKRLERPRATLTRSVGRDTVQITDEASVPTQLCSVKTTTSPDKAAIKRLLEAGEDVPGAMLVRGGDTLTIRSA